MGYGTFAECQGCGLPGQTGMPTNQKLVPGFFDITVLRDGEWARIGINDLKAYAQTCNNMMREYLWWCVDNHKCCDNELILPNADYSRDFKDILSDREKQIRDEEYKQKMEIRRKKAEEEKLAKKAELEQLEAEGRIELKTTRFNAVYDDYYYYDYECSVSDIASLGFQLHYADKLYLHYPGTLSILSDTIIISILEQGLSEVKKAKKEKNDHYKLSDKIYIWDTDQRTYGMIMQKDCNISGLELFGRIIIEIPEIEKDPFVNWGLRKYEAKKVAQGI